MESSHSDLSFFASAALADGGDSWIEQRLRAELPRLHRDIVQSRVSGICPLTDMGDYWLRGLQMISRFANTIAYDGFIQECITGQLHTLLLEEDDGTIGDYLDAKHNALKAIANELNTATNTCIRLWKESPDPADALPAHALEAFSQPIVSQPLNFGHLETYSNTIVANSLESDGDPRGLESIAAADMDTSNASVSSESNPPERATPLAEQLKSRGTGLYTCTYGLECDKGGVLVDGMLKVFKRNSDFRAHMQRHERMFKCDLPGCPNKKGFARIDQLERHKRDVKHRMSPWISERTSG